MHHTTVPACLRPAAMLLASLLLSACAGKVAPLTADVQQRVARQQQAMPALQGQLPAAPLDAAAAVSVALHNNLSLKVSALDTLLASGELDMARLQMLPDFSVQAGYTLRDRVEDSSDPLNRKDYAAQVSWNVLALAGQWLKAQQAGERQLVYRQRYQDTADQVASDTLVAWQQLADFQQQAAALDRADASIDSTQALLQRLQQAQLRDPLVLAQYADTLLALKSQIRSTRLRGDKAASNLGTQLASAGRRVQIAADDTSLPAADLVSALLGVPEDQLEQHALYFRNDLRENDIQARLLREQARMAWTSALPGLQLFYAREYDTDINLDPPSWQQHGFSLAFNLLGLVSAVVQHKQVVLQQQQLELKQLALGYLTVEQVRLSREALQMSHDSWLESQQRADAAEQIAAIRRTRTPFYEDDELDRARAEVQAIQAQVAANQARQDMLQAYWQLLQASGIQLVPAAVLAGAAESASSSQQQLRQYWQQLPAQIQQQLLAIQPAALARTSATAHPAPPLALALSTPTP